jgi:hypothetical protein
VTWSVEPPGAQGTISVIGRVGFHCARAGVAADKARAMARTVRRAIKGFTFVSFWVDGLKTPKPIAQSDLDNLVN